MLGQRLAGQHMGLPLLHMREFNPPVHILLGKILHPCWICCTNFTRICDWRCHVIQLAGPRDPCFSVTLCN